MTIGDGLDVLVQQTGFLAQKSPENCVHDIAHLAAQATGGSVPEEGRAGIFEMVLLGIKHNTVEFKDGKFVPAETSPFTMSDIREHCENLQFDGRMNVSDPEDPIHRMLSEDEIRATIKQAQTIRAHFKNRRGVEFRSLTFDAMLATPLSDLGIEPREIDGKIQFVCVLRVPGTAAPSASLSS